MHVLVPEDGEAAGLLSLMLLTDARRAARTGPEGELIPLDEQDRSLWDTAAIEEGVAFVSQTLSRGSIGAYQLQAAIAAVHDESARAEDTDWPQILALYGLLERMSANPMVTLNRAVALAMVHGPEGPRAPPRAGRGSGGGHRALPRGGQPDVEHARTVLPPPQGRALRWSMKRPEIRENGDGAHELSCRNRRRTCVELGFRRQV